MSLNYYEQNPEDNHFTDVVIDVTHRCNMMCKNCYIPNREIPDMDMNKMLEAIRKFPNKVTIRIIGAEPTMRRDLPELISKIRDTTQHRVTLLTNGLKLSRFNYVQQLKDSGLKNLYLSMNGVDNDDWYEKIDEMRCSTKKMAAMLNSHRLRILRDIGCIIVDGINNDAPSRFIKILDENNISNVTLRFKTIGQIGRFMPDQHQINMDSLIQVMSDQLKLSVDYIKSWQAKWIYPDNRVEEDSFLFPLNPNSRRVYSGIWIKCVNWNNEGKATVLDGSTRRGRLTENFKVAPFFEHVSQNEGGY